ncbi:unnamed protein product, partial [Didymodactylos carnosus]
MIIDTDHHHLTNEQLKFLNNGPTYVPPYQMHVSSSRLLSTTFDIVLKQSRSLRRQFASLFSQFSMHLPRSMTFEQELINIFNDLFSSPLPSSMETRALAEKQLVRSIRNNLKMNNLIVRRTADQQNIFYLGNAVEFEKRIHEYWATT